MIEIYDFPDSQPIIREAIIKKIMENSKIGGGTAMQIP